MTSLVTLKVTLLIETFLTHIPREVYHDVLITREAHRTWLAIIAALWNRAGHYILPCGFSIFYLFPRLISAVADWMSVIYFDTWRGLSANLRCRSETCCTRLAENTGRKKSPKIVIWFQQSY